MNITMGGYALAAAAALVGLAVGMSIGAASAWMRDTFYVLRYYTILAAACIGGCGIVAGVGYVLWHHTAR